MPKILTTQAKFGASGTYQNTMLDNSVSSLNVGEQLTENLANGNLAQQNSRWWESKLRTLIAAASENIDLFDLAALDLGNGAGRDQLGLTQNNTKLIFLMVENLDVSVGNLIVGGEGSLATFNSIFNGSDAASVILEPGAHFQVCSPKNGFAIADVANHLLKIAASGGNCSYKIQMSFRE